MKDFDSRVRTICQMLFLLVFLYQVTSAGVGDWTTYTNMNEVKQILLKTESSGVLQLAE